MQHTRGTHESVYMLPDQRVQRASQGVFEDGAHEALAQARAVVLAAKITDGPDPSHQETAIVDCADETTSPWPDPEGGCGADFLLCLACTNAHVHPGHHPGLRTCTSNCRACGPPWTTAPSAHAGVITCCGWRTFAAKSARPPGRQP